MTMGPEPMMRIVWMSVLRGIVKSRMNVSNGGLMSTFGKRVFRFLVTRAPRPRSLAGNAWARRLRHGILAAAIFCLLLQANVGAADVENKINWEQFLARH